MLKKILFALVIIGLIVAVASFWGGKEGDSQIVENKPIDLVVKGGWVEILSGKAEIIGTNGTRKELQTGDIVNAGDSIEVSKDGKISINLFDGSVLRASEGTKFTINNAEYDKASRKLSLTASLSNGKIWSKIIELATPDSIWKVETSNTVATVRGSAFGVSTDGKVSEIFGSQHKVYVDLVDPVSKNLVKKNPIIIEEDSFIEISSEDIEKVKKIEEKISSTTPPATLAFILKESEKIIAPEKKEGKIKKGGWVTSNEKEDVVVENEIKIIKEKAGGSIEDLNKLLNERVESKFNEIKTEQGEIINKADGSDVKTNDTNNKGEASEETTKVDTTPKQNTVVTPKVIVPTIDTTKPEKWVSLEIETISDIKNIAEGEMISFRAVLKGENGGEKDVTRDAKWQVLGQIGLMERAGTFAAKLDPAISEYGEAFGYIVATWQAESGEQFLGKSDQVHVVIKADSGVAPEEMFIGQ